MPANDFKQMTDWIPTVQQLACHTFSVGFSAINSSSPQSTESSFFFAAILFFVGATSAGGFSLSDSCCWRARARVVLPFFLPALAFVLGGGVGVGNRSMSCGIRSPVAFGDGGSESGGVSASDCCIDCACTWLSSCRSLYSTWTAGAS